MVSVVLALYNGEKYLADQIDSILRQTDSGIELVIIDDCSQDRSFEIAREFAKQDPRTHVYRNSQNLGITKNFLKGISLSHGDYICLSDQDDVWRPDKVAALRQLMAARKDARLVYSDLEICDAGLRSVHPSFWRSAGIKPKHGNLGEIVFLKNFIPGCSMLFTKEVGAIMTRLGEEPSLNHDHMALIISAGLGKIVYTPETLVKYRQHGSNSIGVLSSKPFNKIEFSLDLIKKIEHFKRADIPDLRIDFERLEAFSESYQRGSLLTRLSHLRYYLFLREDNFLKKILGFIECCFPAVYKFARGHAN